MSQMEDPAMVVLSENDSKFQSFQDESVLKNDFQSLPNDKNFFSIQEE